MLYKTNFVTVFFIILSNGFTLARSLNKVCLLNDKSVTFWVTLSRLCRVCAHDLLTSTQNISIFADTQWMHRDRRDSKINKRGQLNQKKGKKERERLHCFVYCHVVLCCVIIQTL